MIPVLRAPASPRLRWLVTIRKVRDGGTHDGRLEGFAGVEDDDDLYLPVVLLGKHTLHGTLHQLGTIVCRDHRGDRGKPGQGTTSPWSTAPETGTEREA